jgi:hypothetical protein
MNRLKKVFLMLLAHIKRILASTYHSNDHIISLNIFQGINNKVFLKILFILPKEVLANSFD